MTEEKTSPGDVKPGADNNSDPASENKIPQERLNKEIDKRKAVEAKLAEEQDARIKAEAKHEALFVKEDPIEKVQEEYDDDEVAFVQKTAKRAAKDAISQAKEEIKGEIATEEAQKKFFANLDESLPKPDMDNLKEYAEENGIRRLQDAYNLFYQADIIDAKTKKVLKDNAGIISEDGKTVNPTDLSEKLAGAKSGEEIEEIMRAAGM